MHADHRPRVQIWRSRRSRPAATDWLIVAATRHCRGGHYPGGGPGDATLNLSAWARAMSSDRNCASGRLRVHHRFWDPIQAPGLAFRRPRPTSPPPRRCAAWVSLVRDANGKALGVSWPGRPPRKISFRKLKLFARGCDYDWVRTRGEAQTPRNWRTAKTFAKGEW